MHLIIDVENTTTKRTVLEKEKVDFLPFRGTNSLVSLGMKPLDKETEYLIFYHSEFEPKKGQLAEQHAQVQKRLDETTLLIGHHLKHDISWV